MTSDDPNDIMTAPVVSASQLPSGYRQDFESMVTKTLCGVFDWSVEDAAPAAAEFMAEAQSEMDGAELLHLFHQSPLQIAVGLAEASDRDLTPDEIDRYSQIVQVRERPEAQRPTDFGMRLR